ELRKIKAENLAKRAEIINHFGTYIATSGIIGGVFALTTLGHASPEEAVRRGLEGVAVGAISPYIIAKILEKPGVVDSLSRVRESDLKRLMKLPPDQRVEVEETLKKMAQEAEAKGLLPRPSPWLRILAGTAARRQVEATHQHRQAVQQGLSSLDDLNRQLGVSGAGLPPLSTLNQPAGAGASTGGASGATQ
ncbi:MAG: hypothetical protein KGR26_11750, partial [Cyanobacteria bacterium REEB65]|nr:hypothetical protein [Cyanobacteria bacterium REEB65]